jgi:hypothetical protein
MLEFTHRADRPTLRLLILHDDAEREFDCTAGAEQGRAPVAYRIHLDGMTCRIHSRTTLGVPADRRSTVRMRAARCRLYADAVGGVAGASTYFIGSLFFTTASFLQVPQVQTVSLTGAGQGQPDTPPAPAIRRPLPHDRAWLAAITQPAGAVLFNVSTLAALARNATVQQQDEHVWRPDRTTRPPAPKATKESE